VRAIRPASALDDFCDLRGTHIGHIANPVSCSWIDDVDNARFIGNGDRMNTDAPLTGRQHALVAVRERRHRIADIPPTDRALAVLANASRRRSNGARAR
jgi:hypothetical protein